MKNPENHGGEPLVGAGSGRATRIPFGLFELDDAGKVVHHSPQPQSEPVERAQSIIGQNFFDDIVPVSPVLDFKSRFLRFMAIGDSAQRFTIRSVFQEEDVRLQIMLARNIEGDERGERRLALVRLMPEKSFTYSETAFA